MAAPDVQVTAEQVNVEVSQSPAPVVEVSQASPVHVDVSQDVVEVAVTQQRSPTVEVQMAGAQGPPGPPGEDRHFMQDFTAVTWVTCQHDFGRYPSVTIINSAHDEIEGFVNHVSFNQCVVSFNNPESGVVYLS